MMKTCPECNSDRVCVTEETMWLVNKFEPYCNTVKMHDSDAKADCLDCGWQGRHDKLKGYREDY